MIVSKLLTSSLPKNQAGPVEKMICDFFGMPKRLAQLIPNDVKVTKPKGNFYCLVVTMATTK